MSTLADDFSSTLTVSDKVVAGDEASQKVSSIDSHDRDGWQKTEDVVASKPHLISHVDSEGIYIDSLMCSNLLSIVSRVRVCVHSVSITVCL